MGNSFTTTPAAPPTGVATITAQVYGALVISRARKMIREFARNAGDTTYYPTFMLDLAFQRAANELIRSAHLCLRTDTQDTVADQASYSITPTGFRCERLDSVFLTGTNVIVRPGNCGLVADSWLYARGNPNWPAGFDYDQCHESARLSIVDYTDLNDFAIANPTTGQPVMIGFQNDGAYNLWPTPDQVYTVNRRWSDFFTVWNLGTPTTSFTNTAGVLSAVVVTDASDNLGGALAATWADAGGGSGATATATLANGALSSVSVGGGGGTGYSSATQLLLGGYNSADQSFNLPDDLLWGVLSLGTPSFLQFNDPEHAFATAKGEEFAAFVKRIAGSVGGLGVKKIIRRG